MNPLGFVIVGVALLVAYGASISWSVRYRAVRRLYDDADAPASTRIDPATSGSPFARWLSLSGYRHPHAPTVFVALTMGLMAAGLILGQIYRAVLLRPLLEMVSNAPGSTAEIFAAILAAGPWILFLGAGSLPAIAVRNARRSRVRAIEQDLPLALELFATMAEAGLGFDAALTNVVRTRGSGRPLTSEFVTFQLDTLAGVPRMQALRHLARRVDVPSLTRFTSALIQAEQVGASIAETLQHQADELRQRRREEALLRAQSLPVKLVFPLVICFLPGIFVSTLAPAIYQMVQVANSVLRGR